VAAREGGVRCTACGREYPEEDGVLRLIAGSQGAPGYDPHFFSTLPAIEDVHFWFRARRRVILDGLRRAVPDLGQRRLFDIGCGSGGLLGFLERSGVPVAGGCDAYLQGLRVARGRIAAPLVLVDEGSLPPLGPGQTLVGLFDVLEHIDDDVGTLAWLHSILEPGGVLCLTVPAHPFLFGEMDRRARHRRRYRRGELRGKLEAAGFQVRRVSHFMASLVPPLVLMRLGPGSGRATHGDPGGEAELRVVPGLNALLQGLLAVEAALGSVVELPFGSSLLAIAVRPAT
jgi:SAM-dependent methyltransferase